MANKDRPMGLRPYGKVLKVMEFTAGAACYPGDCVKMQADGKIDPAAATNDIFGVALSYASGDAQKVLVSIDPEQVYIAQCDEDDVDAVADYGQTVDILATAGNTTYKISRHEVDSSTVLSGTSGQLVVLGLAPNVGNALGAAAEVLVKINEHQIIGENDSTGI